MESQLFTACSDGKVEDVIKLLQNSQININWQDFGLQRTPFYIACQNGHLEIVKLLLIDQRIDVNRPNKNEATPFYNACWKGHIEVVKLLLNDERVKINKATTFDRTPFYIASLNGCIEIVKLLLSDPRVDTGDLTPFWIACVLGEIETVKLLLNKELIDVNKANNNDQTPFYCACRLGYIEIVELLLHDKRVDINMANKDGETPFYIACFKKHLQIVKILLNNKRVDVNKANKDDQTPFYISCYKGYFEVMELLSNDERIDINQPKNNGVTPFSCACYIGQNGHFEVVKYLLECGREIDFNQKDNDSKTALDWARERLSSSQKNSYETGEEYQEAKNNCPKIVELVESFQKNQNETRAKLIKEFNEKLREACEDGNVEDVQKLLQNSQINTNWKGYKYSAAPFFISCEKGHTEIVKLLLNDGRLDINKTTKNGATPFYIACECGQTKIVKLLLNDKRVDINKATSDGWTPLYIACQNGHIKIVKLLLNDKSEINKGNNNGETAFYIACYNRQIEIVKLLLNDERVEVNKKNNNDQTPFYIACENGYIEIVMLLLNNKRVDINKPNDGITPLWIAYEKGHIEVVKILLNNKRVDINHPNKYSQKTLCWVVCENGHIEIMELLLNDERVNINKEENDEATPFWIACQNGQIEIVKLLLSNEGVDINKPNSIGSTPLFVVCDYGHIEIVKILLSNKRADVNKANNNNQTPLYIACREEHIEIVELLLNDNRVDINKAENESQTPLYLACQEGYIEIVKLLLNDERIEVNKANNGETTPLYFACQEGHIDIVKLLLNDNRVDINIAQNSGETPLWIVCEKGYIEIVKLLLNDKRIDINKVNKTAVTPFYIACEKGHIEIVKLLISDQRVDINKSKNDGWTPFYIACFKGHIEIVKLLLNEKRISIRKKNNEEKSIIDIEKEKNHSEIVRLIQEFDTEQRYQEYLKTFQSSPLFCIEDETINEQDFLIFNEYLKKNKNIKELRLTNCGLTSSNILEILKTLIWKYENLQLSNIQNIKIDDIELESTEGLEIIPIEIRNQGTKSIVQYILDLCKSPNSNPLYRTKLMVVGYENVGKTTLLDCLFPLINVIEVPNFFGFNSEYYFSLEGKYLKQYYQGKLYKQYTLENKEWNVTKNIRKELFQDKNDYGIEIKKIKKSKEKIKLYFDNEETRDLWVERISKLVSNKATHGIEVNTHIWKYSTLNQHQYEDVEVSTHFWNSSTLKNKNLETKQNGNKNRNENGNEKKDNDDQVEYSTWDFAGQNDYYNTHHYFLSNRSTFLVLYRMDKGIKGLESLDFWLKSLSSHLNQNYCDEKGKPFYSIIIIGTFLDSIVNDNQNDENKNLRQTKVMEIYDQNGLKSPPSYFEVSCSTLENIDELRKTIFKISSSHSALKLLHEWGICIYFDKPIELSNIIVLDPQHFTKNILGDLFKADESTRQMRLNGIIDYFQLSNIWKGPTNLIDTYLSLLEKFEVCFILKDQQIGNGGQNENEKKLIIPNLLPDPEMIKETKVKNLELLKELEKVEKIVSNQIEKEKIRNEKERIQKENKKMTDIGSQMEEIQSELEKKWPKTIPLNTIEIERIFSFNQVPSEMVSRLLVRFHDKIVDNIIWRRGVLLKHFANENENILCLLEVKIEENLFEIRIRGKERRECLGMMKYIYREVEIVSKNYGGVKWKECVRSPHFSKALIDLNEILEDCKFEIKDRKLICPITHFPIYGEDLLFKTGLLDTLENQNNFGNDYWKFAYQNQNQENETKTIFENSKIYDEELFEGLKKILEIHGFDLSKVEKVIGNENRNLKEKFKLQCQQTFQRCKSNPIRYKNENWYEGNDLELRKSMIQYLGDYISKFKQFGWNYGNNAFVIPMIQGTSEDVAQRICNDGFSAVPASSDDLGYFSSGVYTTSKEKYARKYSKGNPKVFVIGLMIVGNPFPVVEHPFATDKDGKVEMEKQEQKGSNGMDVYKRKVNEKGYFGKPINPGYDSHISLVNGNSTGTAYPITKVEQLNEEWTVDEFVVNESQTYPCYIVYSK